MTAILSSFLQQQRLKAALPHINGTVLDLGCGFGEITELVPESNYVGVDGHPKIVEWLKVNHPGYEFHHYDLDHDQLSLPKQFDTIIMLAVIEHLKYPDNILSQIPNLLNDSGIFIMTTPTPIGNTLHQIGASVGLFSKLAAEDHEIIFTRQIMEPYLSRNGLLIKNYRQFLLGSNQIFICAPVTNKKK